MRTAQRIDLILQVMREVLDLLLNVLVKLDLVVSKQIVHSLLRVLLLEL